MDADPGTRHQMFLKRRMHCSNPVLLGSCHVNVVQMSKEEFSLHQFILHLCESRALAQGINASPCSPPSFCRIVCSTPSASSHMKNDGVPQNMRTKDKPSPPTRMSIHRTSCAQQQTGLRRARLLHATGVSVPCSRRVSVPCSRRLLHANAFVQRRPVRSMQAHLFDAGPKVCWMQAPSVQLQTLVCFLSRKLRKEESLISKKKNPLRLPLTPPCPRDGGRTRRRTWLGSSRLVSSMAVEA